MIVYRVEGVNGYGPYTFPYALVGEESGKHPLPDKDGIDKNKITTWHLFGFKSLDSLVDWFDVETRQKLDDAKFNVLVYEVPDIRVLTGGRQVAFDMDYAKHIETLDIVNFS